MYTVAALYMGFIIVKLQTSLNIAAFSLVKTRAITSYKHCICNMQHFERKSQKLLVIGKRTLLAKQYNLKQK